MQESKGIGFSFTIIGINLFFWMITVVLSYYHYGSLNQGFLQWDAIHYFDIAQKGYSYEYSLAFFPFMPYIWKFSFLPAFLIGLFHVLIVSYGIIRLQKLLNFNHRLFWFWLILPSTIFFHLPYSEAVFFLAGVFLIEGITKNKNWLVLVALFVLCITRPSSSIVLIALLIVNFSDLNLSLKKRFKLGLKYLGAILFGLLLVGLLQYLQTGFLFKFFEAQKYWDNELRIPTFPLRSWDSSFVVRFDGIAFLIGVVAGFIGLGQLIKKEKNFDGINKAKIFSLLFLGGTALSVLLFRGGSLFSINRFIFCAPFFIFILQEFRSLSEKFSLKQHSILFLFLNAYWLLFNSTVHIQAFLKYFLASLLLFWSFGFLGSKKIGNYRLNYWQMIGILILTEMKIYMIIRFVNGEWVA